MVKVDVFIIYLFLGLQFKVFGCETLTLLFKSLGGRYLLA